MASSLAPISSDAVLVEDAGVGKIDGEIERGLSADGRQQREHAGAAFVLEHLRFDANDLFDVFLGERLDVGAVGEVGIGHDGGRVGIHQHDFIALGLERLARLRAGVVELRRLANDDRPRADHENLGYVISAWHVFSVLSWLPCTLEAIVLETPITRLHNYGTTGSRCPLEKAEKVEQGRG